MGELQIAVYNFSAWKAILWLFYPIVAVVMIESLVSGIDNDVHEGGEMILIFHGSQSYPYFIV